MKIEVLNALKIVITTFICSAIIMPFMIKIAKHVGALDVPRSDEGNRHIHTKTTPYFGGLGVFLSFLLGYMIFGTPSIRMNSILIGSFIVILTGITDDIAPIKSWQKLIGHLIAASVIVFYGNITLNNITVFGFNLDFGIFAYPLTIFFIVACTNIINLIDGLDGLSGGICSIFFLTIGIIGLYQGRSGSLVMILTFIMLGATLGFLLYNFHNAKIFAGDCSTFLGFISVRVQRSSAYFLLCSNYNFSYSNIRYTICYYKTNIKGKTNLFSGQATSTPPTIRYEFFSNCNSYYNLCDRYSFLISDNLIYDSRPYYWYYHIFSAFCSKYNF